MHFSIPLLIASLIYLLLVLILFSTKEKQKTVENRIYLFLLFTTLIGVVADISGIYCHIILPETSFIRWFVVKIYMLYLLTFIYLVTVYIICIAKRVEIKVNRFRDLFKYKSVAFLTGFYVISFVLNFILPFEYFNDGKHVYISGLNATYLYCLTGVALIGWLLHTIVKIKYIQRRKVFPIILFVLLCVPVVLLQFSNPELLLVTSLSVFLVVFMYHTIENPDLKMIDELQMYRSLTESSIEDKSLFIFKMSQEIKQPLKNVSNLLKEYNEGNLNNEEINENYKAIDANIDNLNFIVNNIINVSDLDKVRIVDTSYDVRNFFENIKKQTEAKIKENERVRLRYDISDAIPEELYGDYIKLKQAIMIIINNSIKYTEEGIIEIDIDSITRYDLCRLIIKIRDTGCGMPLDQINDILRNNYEFNELEYKKSDESHTNLEMSIKLIRMLGGNVNIKSDIDRGTEITLIIDQKVKENRRTVIAKSISKYSTGLFNRRILIVDDDSDEINKIVKFLSINDVQTSISMYGKECIDKIKAGEKYKIILMDDEMNPDNALPTLEKLKEIKKFNIPVIVMLNRDKEFIKEHYIKDGFTDYLLKDDLEKELRRIIDKYL